VASLATPETILRWYRESVATKYDGSRSRSAAGSQTVRNLNDTIASLCARRFARTGQRDGRS